MNSDVNRKTGCSESTVVKSCRGVRPRETRGSIPPYSRAFVLQAYVGVCGVCVKENARHVVIIILVVVTIIAIVIVFVFVFIVVFVSAGSK